MKKFKTYQDYKNYIYEEWEKGNINELKEDGYTIPEPKQPGSSTINNRLLTEKEFNQNMEKSKYGK